MGRPQKQTADYFPHYVKDEETNRTLFVLENQFSNNGYAFYYRLKELLCLKEGHCYSCANPADWMYFTAVMKVSSEEAKAMLKILAELGEIDRELWERQETIWCQKLVDSLSHLYSKRSQSVPRKPGSKSEYGFSEEKTEFPRRKSPGTNVSGAENPQIKLNKRKEKGKDIIPPGGGDMESEGTGEDLEVQTASGAAENAVDHPKTPKAKTGKSQDPPGFADFWTAYPRKRGKGEARRAWLKLKPDSALTQAILEAVERDKQADQWKGDPKYIPYPATWLNQCRWEDEPESGMQPDPWEEDQELLPDAPIHLGEDTGIQELFR